MPDYYIADGWDDCVDASDEVEGAVTVCPILGCTDPTALNFDENATEDDGSCIDACQACADAGGFYCGDDQSNWTTYSPDGCVPTFGLVMDGKIV